MPETQLISTSLPDLLPQRALRSSLPHVKEVITDIAFRLGHIVDDGSPLDVTRCQLGSALEWAIAARYAADNPTRYVQPGEIIVDGLAGNLDLLDCTDEAVIEIKLTWLSSANDIDSTPLWKFKVQVYAYCYMVGWRVARLLVCHVNGDYKAARSPVAPIWEQKLTERELRENWTMLLRHRDRMIKEGAFKGRI